MYTCEGDQERSQCSAKIATPFATFSLTNHLEEIACEMALVLCLPRQFVEAGASGGCVDIVSHHGHSLSKDDFISRLFPYSQELNRTNPGLAVCTFAKTADARDFRFGQANRIFVVQLPKSLAKR